MHVHVLSVSVVLLVYSCMHNVIQYSNVDVKYTISYTERYKCVCEIQSKVLTNHIIASQLLREVH